MTPHELAAASARMDQAAATYFDSILPFYRQMHDRLTDLKFTDEQAFELVKIYARSISGVE